ncbi:hypothetical protein [Paracidovorax avenae]|uniref:hypothetical protein n=1 Tax=Paracidovorax avenae TaxID=80867 RepID=UPI001F4129C6|nr:hypothetical protein [Paracidovorax avenae]
MAVALSQHCYPPGPLGGRLEAGMACPGYQSLPFSLAGAYERVGIAGTVKVEFRVRDGAVEVNPVADPSERYRTVRSAVPCFQCQAGPGGAGMRWCRWILFFGGVGRELSRLLLA